MLNWSFKFYFLFFFSFCSLYSFSQNLILVNGICKDLPVASLFIGIKNEVYIYDKESKAICKNVSLRYDSSVTVQQKEGGLFVFVPKHYEKRKMFYIRYDNKKEDSLGIEVNYYPLKFNITPNLPNHSTLRNYDIKGLYISDTRYRCDSLLNNFRVLKYTIELVRENKIIKSVTVSRLTDKSKLKSFKKLLQPNDSLYARNILIKSSLGFMHNIDSYLLRVVY